MNASTTTPVCATPPSTARHNPHPPHPAQERTEKTDVLLYTPAQAAIALAVKESWLRRKAGQRTIPCTFLGKHLRFSRADLEAITHASHRRPRQPRRSTR
ncbi:helix-turn-helix domain-containing protein [Allokutzneria albata]|uniref:DNA binding domain-containing protein, excisionase family n=1 Tax=Allokutzneria albata TaxID=211114 RepID=A0A1G9YA77_ALLAB|nr:helix-turn-helix domain-containing protein [Allokutzneria albata]SDN05421.1 DNA binding domain-containing protein, excisionase family [Allokutzneria albata]